MPKKRRKVDAKSAAQAVIAWLHVDVAGGTPLVTQGGAVH